MMEKNAVKLTCLLVFIVAELIAVGAVRAESGQVVVDTTWQGWPDVPKVYNTAISGGTVRTVPMVDLDTNTYEKKFWLSEKQLLSEPILATEAKVVGRGSLAYVVYSLVFPDPIGCFIYRTYSDDYGANWSPSYQIQATGMANSGSPFPIIHDSNVYVAYQAHIPPGPWLQELLFRYETIDLFIMSESTVIDETSGSSSEGIYGPNLLTWQDTLFCLYLYHDDGVSYTTIQKSFDRGATWIPLNSDAGTAPGVPLSCFLNDTVMSIVHRGGNEVVNIRSFDGGHTWIPDEYISADDIYASQGPRGAGDGVSAIHAIWWDFEGASAGWYGFPFYRRSLDNGETWEEIGSLSGGANTDYVDVWADSNRTYAIYNDCRWGSPDFSIFLRYSHDQGASWAEEIQLTDEIDPARRPDI